MECSKKSLPVNNLFLHCAECRSFKKCLPIYREMMKLTYWVAENLKGDRTDSIVARTKHDCEQKVIAYGSPEDYGPPVKKSILYQDAFDLFEIVTGKDVGRGIG